MSFSIARPSGRYISKCKNNGFPPNRQTFRCYFSEKGQQKHLKRHRNTMRLGPPFRSVGAAIQVAWSLQTLQNHCTFKQYTKKAFHVCFSHFPCIRRLNVLYFHNLTVIIRTKLDIGIGQCRIFATALPLPTAAVPPPGAQGSVSHSRPPIKGGHTEGIHDTTLGEGEG